MITAKNKIISRGDVYWVDLDRIPKINTHGQRGKTSLYCY